MPHSRISQENVDYTLMEIQRLQDRDTEHAHLIQSMSQEILQLCQEVATLTAIVTTAPRTTPEVEEQIATIHTAIEETSH